MRQTTALTLMKIDPPGSNYRWFSSDGCVVYSDEGARVFVGHTIIGSFGRKDVLVRNLLLVGLAQDRWIKKGRLAQGFGLSAEQLRRIVRHVEAQGLGAIPARPRGGRKAKVTVELRQRLEQMFESGANAREAFQKVGMKAALSYRSTCWRHPPSRRRG